MGMEIVAVEVCPTKDFILALLDFLVDPLLPSKCLSKDSPLQEDLVAKQMHAVVLLYNYYHRKLDLALEFLEYDSFCKMAMALKPNLLPYLSLIQRPDYGALELNDMDKHMSLVEKSVLNGCDVSRSLDASIIKPDIEAWPVSRVAVFLVDLKKENCFLFHSSVTQGVWSLIEEDVTLPGEDSANKKKRVIRKTLKETDEAFLQQVAFSSVKEACAFKQGDLRILEAHMAYSTSKEKTTVRLYIMQCRNSKPDFDLVPISDALGSLQGPLVRKDFGSWLFTPVVEYFHLLPFAEKVSDWHSRSKAIQVNGTLVETEEWPNPSQDVEEIDELDGCNGSNANDKNDSTINVKKELFPAPSEPKVYKKRNRPQKNISRQEKECPVIGSRQEKECPVIGSPISTDVHERCRYHADDQKQIVVSHEPDQPAFNRDVIVAAENDDTISCKRNEAEHYFDQEQKQDIVPLKSDSEFLQTLQLTIAPKQDKMSQTALNVQHRKRELLTQQFRQIADELALCESNIEIILEGGEGRLAVVINSLMDGCNDSSLRSTATESKTGMQLEDPVLPLPPIKRMKLSEATLSFVTPSQELDRICNENTWTLPIYNVSTLEGGFKASVIVKGVDFECTSEATLSPAPQDARNSAALLMLAKLQSMRRNRSS